MTDIVRIEEIRKMTETAIQEKDYMISKKVSELIKTKINPEISSKASLGETSVTVDVDDKVVANRLITVLRFEGYDVVPDHDFPGIVRLTISWETEKKVSKGHVGENGVYYDR